jgi:hypothetical protein
MPDTAAKTVVADDDPLKSRSEKRLRSEPRREPAADAALLDVVARSILVVDTKEEAADVAQR